VPAALKDIPTSCEYSEGVGRKGGEGGGNGIGEEGGLLEDTETAQMRTAATVTESLMLLSGPVAVLYTFANEASSPLLCDHD